MVVTAVVVVVVVIVAMAMNNDVCLLNFDGCGLNIAKGNSICSDGSSGSSRRRPSDKTSSRR